jgi:anti-sigma factor RsiW
LTIERELTCAELVELVTAYLENRLDARDAARVEEHLAACDGCATYVEQMRATIAATGMLREMDIPQELQDRLLAALREWKRT